MKSQRRVGSFKRNQPKSKEETISVPKVKLEGKVIGREVKVREQINHFVEFAE